MKRQRKLKGEGEGEGDVNVLAGDVGAATAAKPTMKKTRKMVEKEKGELGKVAEERTDAGECIAVAAAEQDLLGCEEWRWAVGVVDEQMSWGSIWLPFWDVEFMGEAYSALFSDVVWDMDIWNLRSIKEIPNP